MNIIGKATINPILFYTGKVSGYLTWVLLMISFTHVLNVSKNPIAFLRYLSFFLFAAGLLVATVSLINLGKSTRLGLPLEDTAFKTNGIYKYSRNPMYLGFDCLTLASMLLTLNPVVLLLGLYSIAVYHLIILGEEKYLESAFKEEYSKYRAKTRRYL
jgi:protein-S-isoprenylcysteine O-methyltransferase Ste14